MKRLSLFIIIFSVASAVFFMAPALLSKQFGLYPLMKMGDVLDILTPLVLLPLYWLLYRIDGKKLLSLSGTVLFVLFAAFWVEGQGMHLSANAISHLLKGMESSDVYKLTNFYDEILSHYLWHIGIVGLSALIIFRQWRNPFIEEQTAVWPLILAGVLHGFTFFVMVIEAGTAPLGVTFALLVVFLVLVWGRKKMSQRPLLTYFFVSFSVAAIFFIGWAIYWGGLPEFSQVGIID